MEQADQQRLDRHFMARALALTRRGLGRSSPNPAVGALVVAEGRIVGRGWHVKKGQPHAEPLALAQAGAAARGATLYVTLEPCNHQGATPPCTQAILRAGVARVVYGADDPNPTVAGGGGAFLAGRGLAVEAGVLAEQCAFEHRFFLTHITKGRPHVILKTAATLDGKTATASGDSRWITGPASRRFVHRLRGWCDCVCVGVGTALVDDPQLTCRLPGGRDPLRVIVDSRLRIDHRAKVFDPAAGGGCLVACGPLARPADMERLRAVGAEVLRLSPAAGGGLDLAELLDHLGRRGVIGMLLEGGATLAWGFLSQGLVDEVMYFFAPKLLGGATAAPMLGGAGVAAMAQAIELCAPRLRRFNPDVLLWASLAAPVDHAR